MENPFVDAQVTQVAEGYGALPDQVRGVIDAMIGGVSTDTQTAFKSMAAMLVALIPTLQGNRPTTKGVPLRAHTLPTFDGKSPMQLYNFFQQCELHFHAHGEDINSSASLAKLSTYFTDGALQFLVSQLPDIASKGWEHFKLELLAHYGLFTNFQATIHALLNLCHEPQSVYADYIHTFNSLLHVVKHYRPAYDKELFCIIFRRGLPNSVAAVAAEYVGNDVFELQNHIASRIVRNPVLAKQTGVSSSTTGPTPMDLGFAKTARVHVAQQDPTPPPPPPPVDYNEGYDDYNGGYDDGYDDGCGGDYEAEINAGFTSKGKPYRGGRGGRGYGGRNSGGYSRGGYQQRGGYTNRGGGSHSNRGGYNNAARGGGQNHNRSTQPTQGKGRFTPDGKPICNFCGIPGHIQKDCRKLKYQQQGRVHFVEGEHQPQQSQQAQDDTRVPVQPFLVM